jgi:uncharacterized phiE125 gp8 family phage protein
MNTETLAEPRMVEVVTAVSVEPITLSEAKAHLRVGFTTDDAYITALITIARQQAEHEAQRSFAPQTLRVRASTWGDGIALPRGPLNSVSHVRYQDAANVQQTLSVSAYYVDRAAFVPVVRNASGSKWPNTYPHNDVIEVQYTAGTWGVAAGVESPKSALHYMLLLISSMYEHREADAATAVQRIPYVDRLLDPYRVHGVG